MTTQYPVTVPHPWTAKHEGLFVDAARRILAPAVGKPVELIMERRAKSIEDDGVFRVHFWSGTADAPRDVRPPSTVFGRFKHCGAGLAFRPRGDGILLTDPDTGFVLAELFLGMTLVIHSDVIHCTCQAGPKLVEAIFTWVATRDLPQQTLQSPEQSVRALADLYAAGFQDVHDALHEQRDELKAERARLMASAQATGNDLAVARKKLAAASQANLQDEALTAEMRHLLAHPLVEDVQLTDDAMVVFTAPLQVSDRRDASRPVMRLLGRYRLRIPFTTDHQDVRAINLDRFDGNHQGPHLAHNGRMCVGNMDSTFTSLLQRGEYAVLATAILEFLQTARPDDGWVRESIDGFPVVEAAKEAS